MRDIYLECAADWLSYANSFPVDSPDRDYACEVAAELVSLANLCP